MARVGCDASHRPWFCSNPTMNPNILYLLVKHITVLNENKQVIATRKSKEGRERKNSALKILKR